MAGVSYAPLLSAPLVMCSNECRVIISCFPPVGEAGDIVMSSSVHTYVHPYVCMYHGNHFTVYLITQKILELFKYSCYVYQ